MSYRSFDCDVMIENDFIIACKRCGEQIIVQASDVTYEISNENAPMGIRKEYRFLAELFCPCCNNDIHFEQNISEYPAGSVEGIGNPKCAKGHIVLPPRYNLPTDMEDNVISNLHFTCRNENSSNSIINIVDGNGYVEGGMAGFHSMQKTKQLVNIFVNETGTIRFESNRIQFSQIITKDFHRDTMRLLGKVAEAILVRRCRENEQLNRLWLSKARFVRTPFSTSNRFMAIGTGLLTTKIDYPCKYHPHDTQRDIIWIDENGNVADMVGGTSIGTVHAGLQLKVSMNGYNYLKESIRINKYEVPIVYFPLKNDYEFIVEKFSKYPNVRFIPGETFIDVEEVDKVALNELKEYYPIVFSLIKGDITATELVDFARGKIPLMNGIMSSILSENTDAKIQIIQ